MGNHRWKKGLQMVLILPLIYAVSAAPTCREGQKQRRDEDGYKICCYTSMCNTSQGFEFCKQDQGHDICVNCSRDSFTNDKINTADWTKEINLCIPKPLCDSGELISVGNGCECNLAKGYWGDDSSNCQLDGYNCKRAGQQLRQKDGDCISCDEDKFKPEDGTYGICQDKTKCKEGEEEVDRGTTKRDRRCRAIQIISTSTLAPPAITTNTEPPNEEKENDNGESILRWLLPLCLIPVVLIIVTICLCRKYRIYRHIPELCGRLRCQRRDTRNRSENQKCLPMNESLQNGQKHGDCNSNGSVIPEKEPFLESSFTNGHATGTDETDTSQTLLKSVVDGEQPLLESSLTCGHATDTDETDTSQTLLKSVVDSGDQYPSFGESIFDDDKNLSPDQNGGSLIGTQMSAASNNETSPDNASNTGGNSVYDTARTGSTGNIPNSEIFQSLNTTASNTTQNGEVTKSEPASRVTRNTEVPMVTDTARTGSRGNIPESLTTTANNTTPNHGEISKSKATNKTRPIHSVKPFPRSETTTSSRSQETTTPNDHDQRFPASPTTDGGVDIQTAVNEDNAKLVPNAPYPFDQPSHVNMDRCLPPVEPSDDYVAVGGFSRNDDSIVTETQSESTHENMDDGNRYLLPEETSESESQFSVDQRTSVGENGSSLRTAFGNSLPPVEPSESLDDYVAVGGFSRNDDSIVTETQSESTHENMDDGNRYLLPEETSESESLFSIDQRTSVGENGSSLRTAFGNILAPPESTSTTSSNEPSLPLVEGENPDSITEMSE